MVSSAFLQVFEICTLVGQLQPKIFFFPKLELTNMVQIGFKSFVFFVLLSKIDHFLCYIEVCLILVNRGNINKLPAYTFLISNATLLNML